MAKITAQVLGGAEVQKEATTVGDLKAQLSLPNFQASVNGEPKGDDHVLADYDFVSLASQVKGALQLIRSWSKWDDVALG